MIKSRNLWGLLLLTASVTFAQPDPAGDIAVTEPVSETGEVAIEENAAPIVSSQHIVKLPQAKSVELGEPVIPVATPIQDNVIAPVVSD